MRKKIPNRFYVNDPVALIDDCFNNEFKNYNTFPKNSFIIVNEFKYHFIDFSGKNRAELCYDMRLKDDLSDKIYAFPIFALKSLCNYIPPHLLKYIQPESSTICFICNHKLRGCIEDDRLIYYCKKNKKSHVFKVFTDGNDFGFDIINNGVELHKSIGNGYFSLNGNKRDGNLITWQAIQSKISSLLITS